MNGSDDASITNAGAPAEGLQLWHADDTPPAGGSRESLVRLDDVRSASERINGAAYSDVAPAEDAVVVTVLTGIHTGRTVLIKGPPEQAVVVAGNVLDPAPEPVPWRQDGLAHVAALVGAIIAKLDGLYGELIAAKDGQLAAKDELIAELRRRVEQAERGVLAREQAPAVSHGAPSLEEVKRLRTNNARQAEDLRLLRARIEALEAAPQERQGAQPRPQVQGAQPRPQAQAPATEAGAPIVMRAAGLPLPRWTVGLRWRQVLIVLSLCVVLLAAGLSRVQGPAAHRSTQVHKRVSIAATFVPHTGVPLTGVPLAVSQILGAAAGLLAPRAAAALPNGYVAVVDTGNRRLALLDGAGRLVRSERGGRLLRPVAIVASSHALYVLDAARGAIERYDAMGHFVAELMRNRALSGASSMAMSPRGLLYIANPRLGGIAVLSAGGTILRWITGHRGPGRVTFAQPVDVAAADSGTIFVLDGATGRIIAVSPSGVPATQWPAVPSSPQSPLHLLPLPDGRLLSSDSAGAILVYLRESNLPVFRRELDLPHGQGRAMGPIGLSRTPQGALLVTDTTGNRVLVVPMPG